MLKHLSYFIRINCQIIPPYIVTAESPHTINIVKTGDHNTKHKLLDLIDIALAGVKRLNPVTFM